MLKKLETYTLAEALEDMKVGQTCTAPEGYSIGTIRKTCAQLSAKGYAFQTSTKLGEQTITRLK